MSSLMHEFTNIDPSFPQFETRNSSPTACFKRSHDNFPILYIRLSENFVIAGCKMFGEIILKVPAEFHDCELSLTSEAKEELRIYNSFKLESDCKTKIYSYSTVLRGWGIIQAKNYKIPFALTIPAFCPASFFYSDEDQEKKYIRAEISYMLSCKFKYAGGETEYSTPLNVKGKSSLKTPNFEIERSETINNFLCFAGGTSIFFIQFMNHEHCVPNGTLQYKLLINNHACSLSIRQISSQVVREVAFSGIENDFQIRNVMSKISRMIKIPAKSGIIDKDDFLFTHDIKMDHEGSNTGTTESFLIKCSFWLEISIFYSSKVRKQPVTIKIEFHVDPVALTYKDKIEVPSEINIFHEEIPVFNIFIEG